MVGVVARLRVLRVLSVVALVLIAVGCGDDDSARADAQGPNQPLFGTSPRAYELREIDGKAYAGRDGGSAPFSSDLWLSVGPVPQGMTMLPGLTLATPCGFWSAHDAQILDAQIVVRSTSSHLNERSCDEARFASTERVVAVFSANPTYRFDGSRLSIAADKTSLEFELHVPDVEAQTEQTRSEALAMAEAEGRTAQADVLRARVPTLEDYKAAMNRTIECARAAGVEVSLTEPASPDGLPGYGWTGDTQAHDRCYGEHFIYIDMVFQISREG